MGVETYRGLRYAEPVERFRSSVPATSSWEGVRDATRHGPLAPQRPALPEVYGPAPDAPTAEDCLVLNVHTPHVGGGAPAEPRPVIVFVHGGSFTGGSGSFYDGTALARGADAVVVCLNYRLGILAAFDLDWLGTERDGGGQLWLGDQITALRWLHDNIADYGGDPDLITIIGESAGAVSVAALCAAPAAAGLVHRAVACSTGYLPPDPSTDVVAAVAKARRCGRPEAIEFLRTASTEELLTLQGRGRGIAPQPVAGTPLLPGRIEDLIRFRGADAVPLMVGYASHEGVLLDRVLQMRVGLPRPLTALVCHLVARGVAVHAAEGSAHVAGYLRRLRRATGTRRFGAAFNDLVWTDGFRHGAHVYAETVAAAGSRAFLYLLDLPMRFAGEVIPASHGIDLALTFAVAEDPEATVPAFVDGPAAREVGRDWVAALAHFARHGNPGAALGEWPAYEPTRRASVRVTAQGTRVEDDADRLYREQVWMPEPTR